jgi:hypothetical protein
MCLARARRKVACKGEKRRARDDEEESVLQEREGICPTKTRRKVFRKDEKEDPSQRPKGKCFAKTRRDIRRKGEKRRAPRR